MGSSGFMNDIDWAGIAQKAAIAIAILVVTWILAKIVKAAFTKLGEKIPALSRTDSNGQSGAASLASIASLLVWLFGLVAILQVLGLSQVLTPIQGMLATLLGFLPNIIGAGVVFFIGLLLAKIVRQLIETALGAVPFEKWASSASSKVGEQTGTARTTDGTTTTAYDSSTATHAAPSESGSALSALPKTIATVVFALIMIVVTIAALIHLRDDRATVLARHIDRALGPDVRSGLQGSILQHPRLALVQVTLRR